jgi:hypothetical protein
MNDNGNYTMDDVKLSEGEISFDDWIKKYKPIKNKITKYPDENAEYGLFETYGEELEYVLAQDPKHVWTEVQGDYSMLLVAGVAYVNRLNYFVCEEPWTDDNETVLISIDVECECYDEEAMENEEREEYGDPSCTVCEGYGLKTEYL